MKNYILSLFIIIFVSNKSFADVENTPSVFANFRTCVKFVKVPSNLTLFKLFVDKSGTVSSLQDTIKPNQCYYTSAITETIIDSKDLTSEGGWLISVETNLLNTLKGDIPKTFIDYEYDRSSSVRYFEMSDLQIRSIAVDPSQKSDIEFMKTIKEIQLIYDGSKSRIEYERVNFEHVKTIIKFDKGPDKVMKHKTNTSHN